jgi:hypothetical protein
MDRREPPEISERLQYLGWRVGLSRGGRRRESNPHGFLGRAVRATTIRIALRSRRLSYGPSSGKELGGREKVGQGLATLPGGTPGLPGQGAPLPGEHRSVVRDVFVAAPLPRQEALQVGFEFLGERTPPPGSCSPCPDGPPGTPGRIPGGNPRPDGQPPRRVESPCFTPVHCVRQRSARDQWSIGRPQPPAPLVALAYFQLRGGCVAVHGRAMFCSPAPSKSPSFLPLNSSFRLTGLLRIRILPVPEGAIRGRGRTRLRSARPKGRADRACPVNSFS